jgi:cytochrome c oxidase cbb3-type subunit 1
MTVLPPSGIEPSAVPAERDPLRPATPEIDRSCRNAVMVLFAAAVSWLVLGALFGLIAAIKAHAPGLLAGTAWLTYGRVRPFAADALVYGFVLQAGLGVALWLFCRLGRTILWGERMIIGGMVFWNLGLLLGLLAILAGASSGYEWLEIPRRAAPILFCGYVIAGAWALITLHMRVERLLYVSQWFLVAGLLWFPWIYSTAELLLAYYPVRGVMQEIVRAWYVRNLFELALAPVGLALICYLLPKLLNRPLHSRSLALFGFWFLVIFGGWGSVRESQPAPNWISSVTAVSRVFLLVPVLALAISWYRTWAGRDLRAKPDPILWFVLVGAVSYLLAAVLDTLSVFPRVNHVTGYTLYDQGVIQLRIHGFLAMTLAAGIYHVLPRVLGTFWPAPQWIRIHLWCALGGAALTVLALVIGGLVQGAGINDPQRDFVAVARATVPFLGMGTLGLTGLFAGYLVFGVHVWRLLALQCPCWDWRPFRTFSAAARSVNS